MSAILSITGYAVVAVLAALIGIWILTLRRVVPPQEVHFVTSGSTVYAYGQHTEDSKSVYYKWPSWIPKIGVVVSVLPLTVFDQDLENYEAYDVGRVPFALDVKAFFRIDRPSVAAQRISSFGELLSQLQSILQGSVRTILASEDIETILQGRAEFGAKFTKEVDAQLESWGVTTVKMIELMDIRDAKGSSVIKNIMAKKESLIERQSRIEVAENMRAAQQAEIEAHRSVEVAKQEAAQSVGIRTAEAEREIGVAKEQSVQQVKEQAAITAAKDAAVKQVVTVRAAEIQRDELVVQSEAKAREMQILADAKLVETERMARGITVEGEAKASAERAMQLAPVNAQIELAREIGGNDGYQSYLVRVEQVKANQIVGVAQAEALKQAGIKVIVTGGTVESGVGSIGELFTASGGQKLGSMVEGLMNTPAGQKVAERLGLGDSPTPSAEDGQDPPELPEPPRRERRGGMNGTQRA